MKQSPAHNTGFAPTSLNRALAFVVFTAFVASVPGCGGGREQTADSPAEKAEIELAREGDPAVELVIDYGDGVERRFTRIPHKEGMTALDVLEFAGRHPRGIGLQKSGSGNSALVTKIDDLSNQTGGDGKNWLYRVNGKLADKSAGAYVLAPGDVILWKYEKGLGTGD
jgi:hypothetical protein